MRKKPATVKLDIQRCTSIRTSTVYGIHTHILQMIANHILTDMYDIVQQLNLYSRRQKVHDLKLGTRTIISSNASPLPMHSDNQNCQRQCHPIHPFCLFIPSILGQTHPPIHHTLKKLTSPPLRGGTPLSSHRHSWQHSRQPHHPAHLHVAWYPGGSRLLAIHCLRWNLGAQMLEKSGGFLKVFHRLCWLHQLWSIVVRTRNQSPSEF